MIQEAYVSDEVAKLLKEKGFNEYCFALYDSNKILIQSGIRLNNIQVERVEGSYSAPTLQMAMKWLRDEKNILIYVYPVIDLPVKDNFTFYWRWDGKKKRHDAPHFGDKHNYESYEKAVEMALKYVLEKI